MKKLLVSDIDNTLLPQKETLDGSVLHTFEQVLRQNNISLAYASGRHLQLILESLEKDHLPLPEYLITNVGTTIHELIDGKWEIDQGYHDILSHNWHNFRGIQIHHFLQDIPELERQEEEVQFDFKQSYYVSVDIPYQGLVEMVHRRLQQQGVEAKVIYSVDQVKNIGLLDVLPAHAGKDGAVTYLAKKLDLRLSDVVFAGDSGNDITALTSGAKGILVGNSRQAVKEELEKAIAEKHLEDCVYFAKQTYVAGVIEGLEHHGFITKQ